VNARAKQSRPRRWPAWAPVAGIFLLALLVRVIYTLQQRANPQFIAPVLDPAYHDEWAWKLATGAWKPEGPFFRAPLYPLFLAALYRVFGHDFLAVRLVEGIVGSLSCVLTWAIGERLFSRRVGLVAGFGAALYGVLIHFDAELQIPVLLVFLVLGFFYALLRALGEGKRPLAWSAASGALFGLAAITNPPVAVFLPALLWAFWERWRRGFPRAAIAAFFALAVIPAAIVTIYNATAGHDFVIVASQGGVNFYIGNNPQSDGHTAVVPGTRPDWWGGRFDTIKIAEREMGRPLRDSEVSRYWFRQGLAFITGHPLQWLGLTARKFALFWSAVEIGNNESIPHVEAYSSIMRLPFFGFGLAAPLALAGMALAWRERRRAALLPAAWIALFMAGVVAFFVCARYRIPIVPFLLVFAAFALVEGAALWRRGERRALAVPALVLALALLAVNGQAIGHRENIAQARFLDAIAWRQQGNTAEAERALRDAVRLDPGLAEARNNLANLLAARGERSGALQAYEQAVAASPRNPKAYANLASFYLEAGKPAAAESTITRALAIDPDNSEALRVLGVIREQRGDLAGARDAYTRALRFTRERPRLENNLAGLAMREGNLAEAEQRLRTAVELDPKYALAWSNLGGLYVNSGRLPDAADALRRAAELQPDAARAWQQLADVLQRLGRTDEAAQARARAAR
jgi:Flp pilus assembly protein TadD/4-amino-4-deoxy-L-arabinose transferase-like glycosyltransferase